jgi:hypothetical protein
MKRTYQIRESKAIEKFRSHHANDPGRNSKTARAASTAA